MTDVAAVHFAQDLVRIPSVNPAFDPTSRGEADAGDYVEHWARREGFDVQRQEVFPNRSNVLVTLRRGHGRHLLLNGHLDTVGVAGMTIDPFGGVITGGRLTGRGAADMKGPLAAMMAALVALRDQPNWNGAVTLAAVVDEEYRFAGIARLLIDRPSYDFAVVGEPTELQVVRGCKGCLRFSVVTHGRAAHSSRPWEGASAIVAMARVIDACQAFFDHRLARIREQDFGFSTGSIGLIKGGVGVNIVPHGCTIEIDIRLLPTQSGSATHRALARKLADLILPEGTSFTVSEPALLDPAFAIPADHPFVQDSLAAMSQSEPLVASFSCDASKIAAAGIPTIVLGPGRIQEAHTADESIALVDLQAGADAYTRLAQRLLSS
jgi:acetylornithine deacetylase